VAGTVGHFWLSRVNHIVAGQLFLSSRPGSGTAADGKISRRMAQDRLPHRIV